MTEKPIQVFFSYSHKDEKFKDMLVKHLSTLKRQGVISGWHDRMIVPGSEWDREIDASLSSAEIILLMVSPDFLASDYCWGVEVQKAMQRHGAGEACVIPVVLRWADWSGEPFAKFQALPKNAKPIASWRDRDEAFYDVVQGMKMTIASLRKTQQKREAELQAAARITLEAEDRKWQVEETRHARSYTFEASKPLLLKLVMGAGIVFGLFAFFLAFKFQLQLPNQSAPAPSQMAAEDFFKRGAGKREKGDKHGAIEDYNQVIKLKSDAADAYYNRGLIYKEQGENQSALSDFQKAADLYQQQDNSIMYQTALNQLKELQP